MNKNILLILFLIPLVALSQTRTKYQKGIDEFESHNFVNAREYLLKALKGNKDKEGEINFRIAETYRQGNNFSEALKYYAEAIKAGYEEPAIYYYYGICLFNTGNYAEAKANFEKVINQEPYNLSCKLYLESIKFASEHQKDNPLYNVVNEKKINTKFSDWGMTPIRDFFVFVSVKPDKESKIYQVTGQGYSDFFELKRTGATFAKPKKCKGGINSDYNDGSLYFDAATNTAYYMQCNGENGKEYHCNIYTTTLDKKGKAWLPAKLFDFNSKEYSIGHPAFTKDMNTLYFVSDMPGGKGGKDIWVTRKKGVTWSEPENLGTTINTVNDEMFPFLFNDTILYFSSNGHPGFGGLDIFKSTLRNGKFTKPVNLLQPINSFADDFSIYFTTKDSGYFASNRPGGVGDDDIYSFGAIAFEINIVGKVLDDKTNKKLDKAIILLKGSDGSIDSTVTDAEGNFRFRNIKKDVDYQMVASRFGYLKNSLFASTKGIDISKDTTLGKDNTVKIRKTVFLSEITKEEIVINDIYYDYNKATLRDSSKKELDKIVKILNENPEINIMLNSHTDERGNDNYNLKLSAERAKSCVNYLIEKGINPERLAFKGWGETKLLIKNAKTEEEHQKNRRTTFNILNVEELKSLKNSDAYAQMAEYLASRKRAMDTIRVYNTPKLGFEVSTTATETGDKDVYFRVQFTAPSKAMEKKDQQAIEKKMAGKNYTIEFTIDSKKIYRYTIGPVFTFEDANKLKEQMMEMGYKDSFVIAYKDDEVISITEAKKLLQQQNTKKK